MRIGSVVRGSLGVLAIACILFAGYYFAVWGYFGLSLGEARYEDTGLYWLMLVGGSVAIVLGILICIVWIRKVRKRKRSVR